MRSYRPIRAPGYLIILALLDTCLFLIWVTLSIIWLWAIAIIVTRPWWQGVYVASFLIPVPYFAYLWIKRKKLLLSGERWTTYFQTPRTLAIKAPNRPARFVKRLDCVAYVPRNDTVELRSGETLAFPSKLEGGIWERANGENIVLGWWPGLYADLVIQSKLNKYPWGRYELFAGLIFAVSYPSAVWVSLKYNSPMVFPAVSWLWLVWLVAGKYLFPAYYQYRYLLPPASHPERAPI